jgi:Ca2+-binding EF-hand superfamily protein
MKLNLNEKMKTRLLIEIRKAYYSAQRYNVVSSFALLYHEHELPVDKLGKIVRMSDHLLKLDDHHYFINYVHTTHENAFKAAQNLLYALDKNYNDTNSAIAIDTFDVTKSGTIVINRLIQILEEIKRNSYTRIDDENILNDII